MLNSLEHINKFFEIQISDNIGEDIFAVLKEIIKFSSAYIFYNNPRRLLYSCGNVDAENRLKTDLKVNNTVFGEIIITKKEFSQSEMKLFEVCSKIIASLLKDNEISKIIKAQTEALQSSYLEIKEVEAVKTKFISHISHELRTPLNSILGFTDLLSLAGSLNDKQSEYVGDIKISALHLLEMINDVLDMSKIEAGAIKLTLREFEIEQVVDYVVNIVKPLLISKNLKLVKIIDNYMISADFQKIQQVLFNLLSNAIKFTPNNGVITIKTEQIRNFNILSVKDSGIGIANKNKKRIFEKFEQVDSTISNSTGLGLAIVNELVKLHGGTISLKSVIHKGSEFIIKIPK